MGRARAHAAFAFGVLRDAIGERRGILAERRPPAAGRISSCEVNAADAAGYRIFPNRQQVPETGSAFILAFLRVQGRQRVFERGRTLGKGRQGIFKTELGAGRQRIFERGRTLGKGRQRVFEAGVCF